MNKKIILVFVGFQITTFSLFAQKAKETSLPVATQQPVSAPNENYTLKEKIFKEALKYGDLTVAKQALYEMIVLQPANKSLKDSLAYIYINMGSLKEAILLSREILENDPSNNNILEVKALAEQSLGLSKEALTSYEALYAKTKNVYHLYQISTLQYELKRMAECNSSLDQIFASPEVDKKELNIGTGTRGQQQKIILKAAALNVKGVLAMDLNENKVAKLCFEEALKLSSDFVLAQNNLEFINKKLLPAPKQDKTPAKTTKK